MGCGEAGLHGRDHELRRLQELLSDLSARRVIVVDGPAGSGHTALLDATCVEASRAGVRIARWRAERLAANTPFAAARGLVAAAGLGAHALDDSSDTERAIELLGSAARDADGGLCLVLDDAHFADVGTLEFLVRLAGGPSDVPLAMLIAASDGWADADAAALLDEVRAAPAAALIRLGPLSVPDAAAIVCDRLPDADEIFCEEVAAYTAGNAFLLIAMADDMADRGVAGTVDDARRIHAVVPARVRAIVTSALRILGTEATEVARAVAVLGDGAVLRHVVALTGLATSAAEQAADALVRTRLCEEKRGLSFVEPIVAATVAALHDPFARKRWHRRSADLLADEHGDLDRIAAHLCEATVSADPWVVEQLLAAASVANERGEIRSAMQYLRRALREPPPDALRGRVLTDLAITESRISAPEAPARVEAALAESGPDDRIALLREQARMMWLSNRPADALRWSERALADVSPDSDIHDLAVAELLAAVSMSDLAKLRSYPVLDEILTRANDGWVPDAAALAGTLATVLPFTLGDHRLIMPLVERALTDDLWRLDAPPYGLRPDFVICGCLFADELERGMALADEGVRRARVVGDAVRVGQYSYWRAMIARSGGDLPVVLDAAYDALEAIAGTGYEMSLPYCAGLAALAHLELDESHAANDVLARADKSGVGHAISNLGADDARVHALLACGRPDDARRLAQSVAERLTALHRRDEPTITWRIGATKAALAAGDRASACDLAHEEISIARATHYRGRLGRALRNAVAVCDTGSDAVELLNEAVSVLATTPCQLALAHALVDLGSELHAQGHIEAARDALAQGRELASRCDAPPLAARALAALHATGARPRRTERRGPESLTPAERRVVDLAAAGMTNRQIGEELVLAPRTVEWHLGHAFKKLGVGSRRELSDSLKHG